MHTYPCLYLFVCVCVQGRGGGVSARARGAPAGAPGHHVLRGLTLPRGGRAPPEALPGPPRPGRPAGGGLM